MKQDNSGSSGSAVVGRRDSDAAGTTVVLVADDDPAVTDDIAAVLETDYEVRTAYDSADAIAVLDVEVSVVLLDPNLPGLSARHVLDRVTAEAVDCQVAALVETDVDLTATAYDAALTKPVDPDKLRDTVGRLARRAAYRTALSEYYDLAERYASLSPEDPEREHVRDRLDDLSAQLDDVFGTLETREAYDTALRELRSDP